MNRTFQDRLVNDLRVAGITTREAANVHLAERFVPQHNTTFARAPRDPASAFVALGVVDLDPILSHEETRIVARGNSVTVAGRPLQISAQPGRRSCVGLEVPVRHHLDGRITISRGARLFATFPAVAAPGLWTLPRRWTPGQSAGRPRVAWAIGRDRRRPTSIHGVTLAKAVKSCVKRKRTDYVSTTRLLATLGRGRPANLGASARTETWQPRCDPATSAREEYRGRCTC